MREQLLCIVQRTKHAFHHAVVQQRSNFLALCIGQCAGSDVIRNTAFKALNFGEIAVTSNVGGFGGPG
ncbi:hypothetical protein D3C75_490320 [compost metagenome]